MRSASRTWLLFTLFLFGFTQIAQAQQFRWTHNGARPQAMGNAYVAVADDYNALFYNPAGLARLDDWGVEIINPWLEVSASTVDFISDIVELSSGTSTGGTSGILDLFETQTGKNQHAALGLTPHFIRKY